MATHEDLVDNISTPTEGIPSIQSLIYVIRGKQVMLDSDLAMLYQVETKNLNKAMKRNEKRFPDEFCFQLSKEEFDNLKFQFGTSSSEKNGHGGRRKLPYVYTEQGIAMLSAVLRSDIAIQVSIRIMKTFVEMRKYMANASLLYQKMNAMEVRQIAFEEKTDARFEKVFDYIASHEESNQKIFFEGQVYDAFSLLSNLISKAQKSIILIDGYVDLTTLNVMAKKNTNVAVEIFTLPNARLSKQDVTVFNGQYPPLTAKHITVFHDRFLIIDETDAYHLGASIKDAGKKCFGINRIEDSKTIQKLIDKARMQSTVF
ncbi:MAG: ORF6N domain-containing protein [Lachnospiraceae bacterium]|nr:ORF6N domain-containing protein [Lachnospiraceae bacterium]